jgi:hypothetical protein
MEQELKNLTCAIVMQAVKDYFSYNGKPNKQREVLNDLRSKYMDFITNGMSVIVAEQLELHPNEIAARLKQYKEGNL